MHAILLFAALLTRLADMVSIVESDTTYCDSLFCVTGTISYVIAYQENFCHVLIEEDGIGIDISGTLGTEPPRPGDVICIEGVFADTRTDGVQPQFTRLTTIGHRVPPVPAKGKASEIMSGRHDFHRAHLVGEVCDAGSSGTNPFWNFLSIISDGHRYYAPIPVRGASLGQLEGLIGSKVQLDGFPTSHDRSYRFLDERRFMVADMNHITVIAKPAQDPFSAAPSVADLRRLMPEQISQLGRHKAIGRVLTVWQNNNALLRMSDNRIAIVSFSDPTSAKRGQHVEVIGYPSTDGFILRLSRALSRPFAGTDLVKSDSRSLDADDAKDIASIKAFDQGSRQGRRIRLCGNVAGFPKNKSEMQSFLLEVDGWLLTVDFSSQPQVAKSLEPGCRVRLTGTCVLETESWRVMSNGKLMNGIMLVIDRADDLVILKRPPWWTPLRLSILIVFLLLLLAGILFWNRMLHRLSEKRGLELFRERSANAQAELKTEERTRLAVELHDSLSQILTGAAMQLDAGEIGAAKRILASCRRELRCCLWDLRSHAIDAERFDDAIRETLAPHIGKRQATISLSIPSATLSEPLRHAALRIIREATVNAIRHGHATAISISGKLANRRLSITITDNGRGFDPNVSTGSASGHFGILGMRERARAFNGSLTITSAPGKGTKVAVTLEETPEYDLETA